MAKKIKSLVFIMLILTFCLGVLGCGESKETKAAETDTNNNTIKIVDSAGREVEIKQPVERIVDATNLDGVRTLIELGVQDKLVGTSDSVIDLFDSEAKLKDYSWIIPKIAPELKDVTSIGSFKEPNAQFIMSLQPDVVLMGTNSAELADTLQKQINAPVVCIGSSGSLDFEIYRIVGKIVDKERRAEELIAFCQGEIKKVTDITDKISEKEKKKIFFWVRPLIGDTRTNGQYDPFTLAGAKNVASDAGFEPYETFEVTNEQIIAWNPEMIFKHSAMGTRKGWHTIDSILNEPVIQSVQAIKNKQVYPTMGFFRGWDPATGVTEVFYLAKIMYPEKFADLDVEKEGNEVYKKFYGLDGLYTKMTDIIGLHRWE